MVRAVGWVLAAVSLAGCALSCTEMGCNGTLEVELTGLPATGAADLEITVGATTTTCTFDLDAGTGSCDASVDESITVVDGAATFGVWTGMGADEVEVVQLVATVDGLTVVDDEVDPGWGEPYYPNGKACGGACVSGSVSADLGG